MKKTPPNTGGGGGGSSQWTVKAATSGERSPVLFIHRAVNVHLFFLPNMTMNHDATASEKRVLKKKKKKQKGNTRSNRRDKRVVVPPEQVAEHSDQGRWFQEKPTSLSPLPVRWMGTLNL